MHQLVEPRVRRLVAEHLGVADGELTAEVSLTDDLAADSLDLVEVALALEAEFGISVPEALLDRVRTYGDLVDATAHLAAVRRRHDAGRLQPPALVKARVVSPAGASALERAVSLTPYEAEEISEDALRAGRGTRLELTVPAETTDAALAFVLEQFARLGPRGIQVNVRRDLQGGAAGAHTSAA